MTRDAGPALEFGAVALCRRCRGTGEVRRAADPDAARERARERRHGTLVESPPTMEPCPICGGRGMRPADQVDQDGPGAPPPTVAG